MGRRVERKCGKVKMLFTQLETEREKKRDGDSIELSGCLGCQPPTKVPSRENKEEWLEGPC